MKRRFFFDLHNGGLSHVCETGVEAANLDEVVEAAYAIVREMHDNDEAPVDSWTLIIRGEDGASLKTLYLSTRADDPSTA